MRRVVPYLVAAPFLAMLGLAAWLVTDIAAVRVVSPFAFLASGVAGFGLGRHRPRGDADYFSLAGVALVALAVFCLPFVTRWWGRIGFPLFGVVGVALAAYGAGQRSDGGVGLTRDLGDEDEDDEEYRPWLDDEPEWAERGDSGDASGDEKRQQTDARERERET